MPPQIFAHDLGKPIVDFVLDSQSEDRIWVLLDAHWQPRTSDGRAPEPSGPSEAVKLVQLSSNSVRGVIVYNEFDR